MLLRTIPARRPLHFARGARLTSTSLKTIINRFYTLIALLEFNSPRKKEKIQHTLRYAVSFFFGGGEES